MNRFLGRLLAPLVAALFAFAPTAPASAQPTGGTFTFDEIVDSGHRFFGSVSSGLANVVERAFANYGLPNGYILGQEAGGAFILGVRYGEGTLYTKNAGQYTVYWQGPSIGADVGADGSRTMMLVYDLPSVDGLFRRFGGVNGSAYLVGGIGMTVLTDGDTVIVPITSGVGARLGVNVGYLRFRSRPSWNPF